MILALLAGLAMFAGDVLQALYILVLGRGRATLAGFFDGLSDVTQVISIGGGASTVFGHRIDSTTCLTLGLILVGSVAGAKVGDHLSSRFTPLPRKALP